MSIEVVVVGAVEEVRGSGRVYCVGLNELVKREEGSCYNWASALGCDWCKVKT